MEDINRKYHREKKMKTQKKDLWNITFLNLDMESVSHSRKKLKLELR